MAANQCSAIGAGRAPIVAPGRDPWQETTDDFSQTWYATQVGRTWVYAHQINSKGDQQFVVVNPRTDIRVHFTLQGYLCVGT